MSTPKNEQEMEKIIQEAAIRYPDVYRHRVSAKKLFSKVLDLQFYATDGITDDELFALSGTLMYFSVDKEQQHFIYQHLLAMLYSNDHHEQVLASGLINKIHQVTSDKKKLNLYDEGLLSTRAAASPGAMAGIAIESWRTENELTTKFPWSLSRKEIKEMIQNDKEMLAIINFLKDKGFVLSAAGIGRMIVAGFSPWTTVIIVTSAIFGTVGYFDSKSESSLEQEARRRGMSEL